MFDGGTVKRALKREIEPHIFVRGLDYYRNGRVGSWKANTDAEDGKVKITGEVEGGDLYETLLDFDVEEGAFTKLECSCPYAFACKHAAALGLAFAESLTARAGSAAIPATATATEPPPGGTVDETRLRQALRNLGLSADQVPAELIGRLLQYRHKTTGPKPVPANPKSRTATPAQPRPFDPKKYFIALNGHNSLIPFFFRKEDPYQQASINKVLERNDLTVSQRELLTRIKGGKFGDFRSPRPDPAKLLPLIVEAGFPVYQNFSAYDDRPLTIDLNPPPLKAEIVYEPRPIYADADKVRQEFFLRLSKQYWPGRERWSPDPFIVAGSSVTHLTDNTIALHRMTPLLAAVIARIEPERGHGPGWRTGPCQTRLTGEEIGRFGELRADAIRHLELTTPPPDFTVRKSDVCQPTIVVEFDAAAETLRVIPVMDYGIIRQDVSESVYVSRLASGSRLAHRTPFEQQDSQIVTVEGSVIRHAKVSEEKEFALYQELAERAAALGFTKTLKCVKPGSRQLADYLRSNWPALARFAEDRQYPIVCTKDRLAPERATFRAEFAADVDADGGWLQFDLACYCGDERITPEKLMKYLESGEPYWRRDDGTLVEFANREELERLARLLRSFEAREDGRFVGPLCHAPELEYVMTSSPHYDAARAASFRKFMSRMESGKPVRPVRLPKRYARILRPYQKAGVDWLYFLRSYRFAGILADDMGLGKTLQTLVVLAQERVPGRPSVVVCPKSLLHNWRLEAQKFTPELKVLVMDGTRAERKEMRERLEKHDLIVMSYGTLKRDENDLVGSGVRFNYAVLDEAQFIKNHATKNAQIAKRLPADYRLALTGTPLENNVSEIWSIFDFLMPGFLGSRERFVKQFQKPIMDRGDRQALEHLRRKAGHFMLRRKKSEVAKELPPKIEQVSQCGLNDEQVLLYRSILAKVRSEIFETVERKGFQNSQIHILAGLTKLRQVCNHPALLTDGKDWREYGSAKLDLCLELIGETVGSGRKILVFSQFTRMLDIVSDALRDRGLEHVYLSGKTRDRQAMIDRFNADPAVPIFLISLKAGGTGLNLTAADTVIVFDPWWNPSTENQAVDRAHRIGQTKTVNVYRLLTSGTIEEKIQTLKEKKQRLFDALIGESGDLFKKLTWDDVRGLFAD